ncbi:MAG: polysaccharide pyruvyl transferase family protein [Opitutaceae bacterium]|nr:polysaccharide pyruvyl transferase family protein [Opitutaceae bacterium]
MRIHLGHHFYGAGNLGDDFMLAGFLAAMRTLAPEATFSSCVPFPLEPLRRRFPEIDWQDYTGANRTRCIEASDVWLGLGGSPFQSAQSRWFVDHLVTEAEACARARRPRFFLGVGVQDAAELVDPDVRRLCASSAGIWTRDTASAERLLALPSHPPIAAATDLAHVFFEGSPPPAAAPGRITAVVNFDYGTWPGQAACLETLRALPATDCVWLAQESRDLPGAERALHAALSAAEKTRWRLVVPDVPGAPLREVLARWPSGAWLISARYHAALAGAWAGSRVVVIATNEKLRGAAHELGLPSVAPDANAATFADALASAAPLTRPLVLAALAREACAAFLRSAVAHRR